MITVKTISGREVQFESVAKVFGTARKERNEYFGKYVAEVSAGSPLKLDAVAAKIKELEKEYNNHLANLKALGEAVAAEKKEADDNSFLAMLDNLPADKKAIALAKLQPQQN